MGQTPAGTTTTPEPAALAVERGARLAAQLLAFARRQPLKPVVADLRQLLHTMDDLLQRAIGASVEVALNVEPRLWHTLVDPHQLENVLLNLAINARDAMRGQGRLTIELSNAELDAAYCAPYPEVRPGQYVLLAVSDTGSGIPADVLARIFEPFFTTKPEGEGTGLGLSMAYGFVKQSNGHIKVYSEVGHGTTFKLYLPRSMEQAEALPAVLDGPVVGGTETVLVVEDDPQVQETVVEILRGLGYTVLNAGNADSADRIDITAAAELAAADSSRGSERGVMAGSQAFAAALQAGDDADAGPRTRHRRRQRGARHGRCGGGLDGRAGDGISIGIGRRRAHSQQRGLGGAVGHAGLRIDLVAQHQRQAADAARQVQILGLRRRHLQRDGVDHARLGLVAPHFLRHRQHQNTFEDDLGNGALVAAGRGLG